MPSTELTKAPRLLDLEHDQRDWFSEFREESAFPDESPRPTTETLFTVVQHGRPAPIAVAEPLTAAYRTEAPEPLLLSLFSLVKRVKRAFSPSLTALFIAYLAAIWLTASIGINRREDGQAQKAESAVTSPVASMRPAA